MTEDDDPHPWLEHDDPHLWLEAIDDERALAWVKEQNQATALALSGDGQRALEQRLLSIYESQDKIPYVSKHGAYLYNFWRDDRHMRGLWRRTTLAEYRKQQPAWEVVLDLDALAEEEHENWVFANDTWLLPSNDRVLLSLSRGGGDAVVVREFDVTSKRFVVDGFQLPEAKSRVSWKERDVLYVGTDFGPGSLTDSGYPRLAKEWRRGTPLSAAAPVFSGESSDVTVHLTRDFHQGQYLDVIRRRKGFFSSEVYVLQDGKAVPIDKPADVDVMFFQDQILFRPRTPWQPKPSDDPAPWPAGALLSAPLAAYLQGQRTLQAIYLPQPNQSLYDVTATRNSVLLSLLEDVKSKVLIARHGRDGWTRESLADSGMNTLSLAAFDDADSDAFWITTSGYLLPTQLGLGEPSGAAPQVLHTSKAFFDTTGLEVTQHFATSKDGTRVPYFQVARKDLPLTGDHPTLLTGYGGFEIALTPLYNATLGAAWLERGGVLVAANIRGGGEYGPSWHAAARKARRQDAYDDFSAVADDLFTRGVTKPRRLGIRGGSNGGLLVGVMLTQHPEQFAAVICNVPLLDMRRYHKLLAGASWMAEYGDPDKPEDWAYLSRYSPYQHLRAGAPYPRVLITTSTRDDRVHPGHARKMVARMQSLGYAPLYFENIEGGHAGASNAKQLAHRNALEFVYLYQQLLVPGP